MSSPADPVTYVLDHASELTPLLRTLHAPDHGRVHCYASTRRVVSRVLDAMGSTPAVPPKLDFATAWLIARDIQDIYIDHADRMNAHERLQAIELAYRTGVRVWLVDPEPGGRRALAGQLRKWAIPQITGADFREHWKVHLDATRTPHRDQTLRAWSSPSTCQTATSSTSPTTVDASSTARTVPPSWRSTGLPTIARPNGSRLRRLTATPSSSTPGRPCAPAQPSRKRSSASRQHKPRCLLTERRSGCSSTTSATSTAMVSITSLDAAVARLHGLASPHQAALALIALAFRPQLDAIAAMCVDDISADCTTLRIDGETLICPPCGRSILHAHTFARRLLPHTGEHLFGHSPYDIPHSTSGPATADALSTQLTRIANRTDLPLTRAGAAIGPDHRWIRTRKVRVLDLSAHA